MKAVILAAGIASRLRPLTNSTPKCLLKVGSKSILELTIENLLANSINDIIIVTGYLDSMIVDFMNEKFPFLKITYCHNELYASTNNIYSLWLAYEALAGEDMLLMDSDIIFAKEIIAKLRTSGYKNCLALKKHDVSEEEIKVKADIHGRILEISKEVKPEEAEGESIGIEIFSGALLSELFNVIKRKVVIEKKVNIFYEAAFQDLIDNNHDIFIVDITEHFCMEIDTAADLQLAGELIN